MASLSPEQINEKIDTIISTASELKSAQYLSWWHILPKQDSNEVVSAPLSPKDCQDIQEATRRYLIGEIHTTTFLDKILFIVYPTIPNPTK